MPTIISNQTTSQYLFEGSSDPITTQSNGHNITLQDAQGLSVVKTSNTSTFSVGDIITYTVTITNNSSQYFTGVRVIDNLGGGNLAYVLGIANLTVGTLTYRVNPIATNPLTFTLQQLNVGQTMTLTYNVQVIFNLPSSVLSITNTVQAIGYTSTGTINGFSNNTITRGTSSELSIVKSSSLTSVYPNQVFSYYLSLTNNSDTTATIDNITDQLPANFVLTGVSLAIGNNPAIVLSSSDYTLTDTNFLTIPSATGPTITVPANSSAVITLTGYLT